MPGAGLKRCVKKNDVFFHCIIISKISQDERSIGQFSYFLLGF